MAEACVHGSAEGACERFEPFFERRPGAGDVEALEACAAGAENGAVIEPEAGLVDDLPVERLRFQAVGAEVEPEQVGAFGFDELHLGQTFGEEALRVRDVFLQVGEQRVEPRAAFAVSRLRRQKAEKIWFAVACAVDFLLEPLAQVFFCDEDVRELQPGEVEGLARRSAGDRSGGGFGRERGEGRVLVPGAHEVGVDLVGDDEDIVREADRSQTLQLIAPPDAPDGVVRAAEEQEPDLVFRDFFSIAAKSMRYAPSSKSSELVTSLRPLPSIVLKNG